MAIAVDVDELLCPACGRRPQAPTLGTGFCDPCTEARLLDKYADRELPEIMARRDSWRRRSARPVQTVANRERQRRHRLLERTRPRSPAPAWSDPFVLAEDALNHLANVRAWAVKAMRGSLAEDVDAAAEIVRQLAWGPEGEPPRTLARGIPAESDRPSNTGLLAAIAAGRS